MTGFAGLTLHTSTLVPDGLMVVVNGSRLVVGVTDSEIQEAAHRIVRSGLSDVLRWLDQPEHTGRQLLAAITGDGKP